MLDIGNTRIKVASDERGDLRSLGAVSREGEWRAGLEALLGAVSGFDSMRVATVSTRRDREVLAFLAGFSVRLSVMDACPSDGPIVCAYADHRQMGVDRWLAMYAAFRQEHSAVCVIDAGTAITLDRVDAQGRHLGGAIIPGIPAMGESLRALDLSLGRLRPRLGLGASTQECIEAGFGLAIHGLVGTAVRDSDPPPSIWLTGGDGAYVARLLGREARVDPLLVLRGLSLIEMGDTA